MNETDCTDSRRQSWGHELAWATSRITASAILLDDDGGVCYANPSAHALAEKAWPHRGAGPAELLRLLPRHTWDEAERDGRGTAEVVVQDSSMVLEFVACAGMHEGALRRYVVIYDVSARSSRESELQRRHDELQSTYLRLASAQEQLLQSEKMASIGQLAAGVAHEINNPIGYVHSNLGTLQEYVDALLTLVDGYADAIASDDPAGRRDSLRTLRERLDVDFIVGDVPKLLEESREGIERVTKIVQDLKEFSHIGRDESMRPSDLRKGLESTLNIVWNDLKYKTRVERHYADLPLVECHLSEINQVFMNLLINAGQAISDRGTITLAMGVEGDEVWVSVADDGCGIPDEALQRIFEPFYTTKPIGRGTGLGLAIAYRIVAKHHGRIEVSSRPGAGSLFRVVLPIAQPQLSRS
ncbi:ATP-binding protein [Lysobacter niastensis]|uniref:histidine kinase n=1 Tax=Lysobacter niastensis TaxID=380629 RepID=A0ABS0BCS9_9GAMM|nr:ATP-binding protein [Lysobacter niastensis]MBF6025581.1 sensor histidine kinase [Lysobacter niastensis]